MTALRLDRDTFLARHWQREPLLIPGALPDFTPPLSADELAGLAMERGVESRIVEYAQGRWQLHHGPFRPEQFQRANPWTLLVQAVDQWLPEVARLRDLVDFLPAWRIDDVMVSYAVDGGSAGPHYDHYDVFLLQGEGEKLWRIGQRCAPGTGGEPQGGLRILEGFACREEHVLRRGDVLYLPPGVAHWGIGRGECTTFSLGFRAPRLNDMLSRHVDALLERMDPERFFQDSGRAPAGRAGEIAAADIRRALAQIEAALREHRDARWFGELVTEPRYNCRPGKRELAAARRRLADPDACVSQHPAGKLAWRLEDSGFTLYANGDSLACDASLLPWIEALCEGQRLDRAALEVLDALPGGARSLEFLLQTGAIDVD